MVMNSKDLPILIALAVGELAIFLYLTRLLLTRYQIRMHELMLTLVISASPIFFSVAKSVEEGGHSFVIELVAAIPCLFIYGASIWALSAIKVLAIEGTWPRLKMMFIGWGLMVGFLSFCMAIIWVLAFLQPQRGAAPKVNSNWLLVLLGLFALSLLGLPGLMVEMRCRRIRRGDKPPEAS